MEQRKKPVSAIELTELIVAHLKKGWLTKHVETVEISKLDSSSGGPNWNVTEYRPHLFPEELREANERVAEMRGTYDLADSPS